VINVRQLGSDLDCVLTDPTPRRPLSGDRNCSTKSLGSFIGGLYVTFLHRSPSPLSLLWIVTIQLEFSGQLGIPPRLQQYREAKYTPREKQKPETGFA